MADKFAETYPCFFPLGEQGGFLTVISDGDSCFPLLTDRDVVDRFFDEKYASEPEMPRPVHEMKNRATLLDTLRIMATGLRSGHHKVSHVAFDVCGQQIIARTTIAEFIDYLENTGKS